MTGIAAGTLGVEQPAGGLLPAGCFDPLPMSGTDGKYVGKDNLHYDVIGSAVTLLTALSFLCDRDGYSYDRRDMEIKEAERMAFQHLGTDVLGAYGTASPTDVFEDGIVCRYGDSFDDASVDCACKLSAYALNAGGAARYGHPSRIRPDDRTCNNIRSMVRRCVGFFINNGPVDMIGFDLSPGAGSRITEGWGNYLTGPTIWDMSISNDPLPKALTLQLLVRYVMCRHSGDPKLEAVRNMGIVNPRLNCAYIASASSVPEEAVERVERDIVGYGQRLTLNP